MKREDDESTADQAEPGQRPDEADAPESASSAPGGDESASRRSPARKKRSRPRTERESKQAPPPSPSRMGLIAVAALAAGVAGGWFGHIARAQAKVRGEVVAAAIGSGAPAGPCGSWQTKICSGSGENSIACSQAKGATSLLTPSTCELALTTVPATLARVKADRATCDGLVTKLCADLPQGSKTCDFVKDRTPSFPKERCEGMLAHYDEVIQELKQMDQAQGMGMPPGHGGPPGMPPSTP